MILGLVCARYHSKGLPGKNVRPMHGVPLIEYAIGKGMASMCDEVMVSTDIPRSVWSMNVQRIDRPEELCGPDVAKWDVWKHAQAETGADAVVDIDVTRPLTLPEDVDGCITGLRTAPEGTDVVMAIAAAKKHPAFDIVTGHAYGLQLWAPSATEYTARQQVPPAYYHGGVYAVRKSALIRHGSLWPCLVKGYEIDPGRAYDIDDETDWRIVEMLMADRLVPA